MVKLNAFLFIVLIIFCFGSCSPSKSKKGKSLEIPTDSSSNQKPKTIKVGAASIDSYIDLINNNKVALVVNQTSKIGNTHLADTLLSLDVNIRSIFSPEHGFRGEADAGEKVVDGIDIKTGISLLSLYGNNKKPRPEQLADIDIVIFDIQDVGARFYTFISTMHYMMEACAENRVKLLILDRPNPNGHYVDGPILSPDYQSFVGMHPISIVHGMTIGEYAKMVNKEGWLKNGIQCNLTIIPCENYTHEMPYELPIKPSPNLPNNRSIYLYPSLCLFEGTVLSVGRGTNTQFQVFGHPDLTIGDHQFTPKSMEGAKYPKLEGKVCRGYDLTTIKLNKIRKAKALNLSYIITAYQNFQDKDNFFLKNLFFDKLAGGNVLRKQIITGKSEKEIRISWQKGLNDFKKIRAKYLLYDDVN